MNIIKNEEDLLMEIRRRFLNNTQWLYQIKKNKEIKIIHLFNT